MESSENSVISPRIFNTILENCVCSVQSSKKLSYLIKHFTNLQQICHFSDVTSAQSPVIFSKPT